MNNTKDLYGSEYDSEDDQGFFLTPVLHYDISNKIKEANKILFDENALNTNDNEYEERNTDLNRRCVTFSKELVSYAPNFILDGTTTTDDEEELSIKEELDVVNAFKTKTIEKICELNEIIDEIDNNMILEQVNTTTTSTQNTVEDTKKSLLELDVPNCKPATTTDKAQNLPVQQEVAKAFDEEKADDDDDDGKNDEEDAEEDDEEDDNEAADTLSMQVGIIARSQIRHEIKEKKLKGINSTIYSTHPKMSSNKRSNAEKPKVTTPKFNYKTCCEYQQSRLPQYKGHISEYGLSLRERERLLQLHKRQELNLLEHETRIQNETMHRLTANEKAFGAWLINKCRNAPNRTSNMFDCPKLSKKLKTSTKQLKNSVEAQNKNI